MRAEHLAEPPWDPALVRRLERRALRPGVLDPAPAREILARHRGMMPHLPLAELAARRAAPESDGAATPVVYGKPVAADGPASAGVPVAVSPVSGGVAVAAEMPMAAGLPVTAGMPVAGGMPVGAGGPVPGGVPAAGVPIVSGVPVVSGVSDGVRSREPVAFSGPGSHGAAPLTRPAPGGVPAGAPLPLAGSGTTGPGTTGLGTTGPGTTGLGTTGLGTTGPVPDTIGPSSAPPGTAVRRAADPGTGGHAAAGPGTAASPSTAPARPVTPGPAAGGPLVVQRKLAAPSPGRTARPGSPGLPRTRARAPEAGAAGHVRTASRDRAGGPPVVSPLDRPSLNQPSVDRPSGAAVDRRPVTPVDHRAPAVGSVAPPIARPTRPDHADHAAATGGLPLVAPARPPLRTGEPLLLARAPADPSPGRNGRAAAAGPPVRPEPARTVPARTVPLDGDAHAARGQARPASPAPVDIDHIVETVHRRFARRLAIEAERRGTR
ncbi:hypothetical protein [Sphaerisporangium corydalis]|uniref:Uncharacterized protein n=1 Tax=Sphaerisporangium corydalis TaxID=1441875 RepID=A0ABV9E606_9ACTN|nr:hypothetical protein [Sphaerisporangium corydalis]